MRKSKLSSMTAADLCIARSRLRNERFAKDESYGPMEAATEKVTETFAKNSASSYTIIT